MENYWKRQKDQLLRDKGWAKEKMSFKIFSAIQSVQNNELPGSASSSLFRKRPLYLLTMKYLFTRLP
jgi:hypothetical protein